VSDPKIPCPECGRSAHAGPCRDPQPSRRSYLATAIQRETGPWTTARVQALYAASPWAAHRNTARKDVRAAVRAGLLVPAPGTGNRTYTRKDAAA